MRLIAIRIALLVAAAALTAGLVSFYTGAAFSLALTPQLSALYFIPVNLVCLWLLRRQLHANGSSLRQLAERKDEAFFIRRRFESAAAFLRQYRNLSGIVLTQSAENVVWLNPLARHKTPPEIVTAIQRLNP